jgi:hypothetical protein
VSLLFARRPAPLPIDHGQLLDAVPTVNRALRSEWKDGALVLWVPLRQRWWFHLLGWLLPLRKERGIELDETGREVWLACDGERRLEQIIEEFADRHQLKFHEARLCIVAFLRSLAERNLLALVVPVSGAARAEAAPALEGAP